MISKEQVERGTQRVSDMASEYARGASDAVRENYDYLASSAQRRYDDTVRNVARRPLESVAIALGAGLLVGLVMSMSLFSRRR